MFTPSNALSLIRGPLGFLFLIDNPMIRIAVLFFAMLSDVIDGYIARKLKWTSRLGRLLDPAMDKLFVIIVLSILFSEERIAFWQVIMMMSRDIALIAFGAVLAAAWRLGRYKFRPVKWGKVSTGMQFIILIAIVLGTAIPPFIFFLFTLIGTLVFVELCISLRKDIVSS